MKDFSKEIKAYALRNALEFGKAEIGRILPKLFNHGLDKKDIKIVMPKISEIVKQVNGIKKEEREREFEKLKDFVKEHEEAKEKELAELPNPSKHMVFRLAPFPSGAMHIGHARTYMLNAMYSEKYVGKTLFVIDDTIGSEEKQILPEAYDLLKEGFDWLGVKYEEPIIYKSDRLEIYYKYAEELINKDKAYVCTCDVETLRKNREQGKDCEHRNLAVKEQLKRWKEMFKWKPGKGVLRIKTSMQHPNPAFRDRVLFKISDRKHPRVGNKYSVWPTLEMSWAVDDHLLGITHIIRGNDLLIETDMEKYMWDIFKWEHPETIHNGMLRIEGAEAKISKSKSQKEILSGKFIGWDDPRTMSLQSLRRRGIKPEAVREFIKEIGLTKQDSAVPIDVFYSISRKMIDKEANRYSFVADEKEISISKAPDLEEVDIPVHPDKKETRKVAITGKIYVSGNDFKNLKGKEARLIHLYNIKLDKKAKFTSEENKDIPKINWVSKSTKAKVFMPDGKWISGLAEEDIKNLRVGEVVQFERFGFVKFDKVGEDGALEFWFTHK